MNFLKKNKITAGNIIKFGGATVIVLILLALVTSIVKITFQEIGGGLSRKLTPTSMPFMEGYSTASDSVSSSRGKMGVELSVRNVAGSDVFPPYYGGTTGSTAEDFEVTDYYAQIETRRLQKTCDALRALKADTAVIFENSNNSTTNCSYTFKVENAEVQRILAVIKKLDPRALSESAYTIKQQIDDFTSETEILEKKRASIDSTLDSALKAYEEITKLATKTQNAEALAKIIDSKIQIIDRLTGERIAINEQLDRLARAKVDQLDRLNYTRFNVSVDEQTYFDMDRFTDSWRQEIRGLVDGVNLAVQFLTVRLLAFLLWLLPLILYVFILVIVAKFSWKAIRTLWFR